MDMGSQNQRFIVQKVQKAQRKPDVVGITCMDSRFISEAIIFLRGSLKLEPDIVAIPGGASPDDSAEEYLPELLSRVAGVMGEKGIQRIVAFGHADCLAHGGSDSFSDSHEEQTYHEACLRDRFIDLIRNVFPESGYSWDSVHVMFVFVSLSENQVDFQILGEETIVLAGGFLTDMAEGDRDTPMMSPAFA